MEQERRKYSDEELIAQIQMLARESGRTPSMMEFNNDPRVGSAGTAQKFFGSWNDFVKAAGLQVNGVRPQFSDEELIAQLKTVINESGGEVPTQAKFTRDPRTAGILTIKEHFGTWSNFIKAAGARPRRMNQDGVSNETLIEDARRLTAKLGKIPSITEFNKDPDCASATTAIKRFGSWNKFLEAAEVKKVITKD